PYLSDDAPTSPFYTPALHDALPIFGEARLPMSHGASLQGDPQAVDTWANNPLNPHRIRDSRLAEEAEFFRELEERAGQEPELRQDRKSTRLNSSHVKISYAVFCMKK